MPDYDIYQADAFASELFHGNPAAVVPLTEWLPDEVMLAIAVENNLAETAYLIRMGDGYYKLRWFTPGIEIALCGHATLATAHILYTELGETADTLSFETMSGTLNVEQHGDFYAMDFPASDQYVPADQHKTELRQALGAEPVDIVDGAFLLAVFEDSATVREMTPDMTRIMGLKPDNDHVGCVLVTAPEQGGGEQGGREPGYDFVSRFFAPGVGIPEDPVTGSAHCMTTPYWAGKLGKTDFRAWQASPRGGEVLCSLRDDRVILKGKAVTYLRGRISL